ncbi:hypothetical protein CTheo_5622 [Ceratobasidium theobromae]|uniref:Uncharacterized protein n=1 Tax=Ceratobasidium theobromae TaxID=1582974 RepID=A0A5N5QHH1_9AGAM|nr:hypothetical protein CTheo_5622 [Ceratobasidium theobromae]
MISSNLYWEFESLRHKLWDSDSATQRNEHDAAQQPQSPTTEIFPRLRKMSSFIQPRQRKMSVQSACFAAHRLASVVITAPDTGSPAASVPEQPAEPKSPGKSNARWHQILPASDALINRPVVGQYDHQDQHHGIHEGRVAIEPPSTSFSRTGGTPTRIPMSLDFSALDRKPLAPRTRQQYPSAPAQLGVINKPSPLNARHDRVPISPSRASGSHEPSDYHPAARSVRPTEVSPRSARFCDSPQAQSATRSPHNLAGAIIPETVTTPSDVQSPELDRILSEFEQYNREHMHGLPTLFDHGSPTGSSSSGDTLHSGISPYGHYVLESDKREATFPKLF